MLPASEGSNEPIVVWCGALQCGKEEAALENILEVETVFLVLQDKRL